MIQVDDSVPEPACRRGRTLSPAEQGPAQYQQFNRAPPDGTNVDEEMLFISPPPAAFPRILPGL